MTRTGIIFLFMLLSFCAGANAQGTNDAKIKQQINQVAAKMHTMQCDFVQTKRLKMLNQEMVSKGKLYYQQGNKLRWEYTSPYSYIFILNDSKVTIKNSHRNDVIDVKQNKMFSEIARIMMNSVVGNCLNDTKNFSIGIVTTGNEWVATMIPLKKDMKQMFQKILLHFDRQRSVVSKVELIEKNGDKTVIVMKNVKTNTPINAKVFASN